MSTATANKPAATENKAPEAAKVEDKKTSPEVKQDAAVVNEARYEELLGKFNKFLLSDEEEEEFNKLRKGKKQQLQGCLSAIQQAVRLIVDNKVSLGELVDSKAFTAEDIKTEYQGFFPDFNKAKRGPKAASQDGEKTARQAKDFGSQVIQIKVPGKKGKATTLSQKSPFPAATTPFGGGFQHVKDMKGDIMTNLKSFALDTPEAKEFITSQEGHESLTKWAGWISRGGKKA